MGRAECESDLPISSFYFCRYDIVLKTCRMIQCFYHPGNCREAQIQAKCVKDSLIQGMAFGYDPNHNSLRGSFCNKAVAFGGLDLDHSSSP